MTGGKGQWLSRVTRELRDAIEAICPGELDIAEVEQGARHTKIWLLNRSGKRTFIVVSRDTADPVYRGHTPRGPAMLRQTLRKASRAS